MKFIFEPATIQGEGTFVGLPVDVFRVVGCSVGCGFCDEPARADVPDAIEYSARALAQLRTGSDRALMVTGGEPLQQLTRSAMREIGRQIWNEPHYAPVLLETSGVGDVSLVGELFGECPARTVCAVTLSPKALTCDSIAAHPAGAEKWWRAISHDATYLTVKYLFAGGRIMFPLLAAPPALSVTWEIVVQPLWQEVASIGFAAWLRENYEKIMLALSCDPLYTTLRDKYSGVVVRILPQIHKL